MLAPCSLALGSVRVSSSIMIIKYIYWCTHPRQSLLGSAGWRLGSARYRLGAMAPWLVMSVRSPAKHSVPLGRALVFTVSHSVFPRRATSIAPVGFIEPSQIVLYSEHFPFCPPKSGTRVVVVIARTSPVCPPPNWSLDDYHCFCLSLHFSLKPTFCSLFILELKV